MNHRNTGAVNTARDSIIKAAHMIEISALRFCRYCEPIGSTRKTPRWAWYGGEPVNETELRRRVENLVKHKIIRRTQ